MNYNPYFPNPIEVIKETILSGDFYLLYFLKWTLIVMIGMFSFKIINYVFFKYKQKKWVLISQVLNFL